MYKSVVKRIIDIVLSFIGIMFCSVPMAIIAIAVKLDSSGPVVFKQERIGYTGKVYNILKFRTMCVGAEQMGSGVYSGKNDSRITRVGNVLRKTSLDEIPQLFNVLKGDMSFVGPRPPLTYHPWPIEQYTKEQFKMFDVRPGITGWAQVNGRKGVEWNHRIELNVWYVDNVSFLLDLKIMWLTVWKVLTNADNENVGQTVYITNRPRVAKIAESAGVDRIFIDLEYIGKSDRQGGMDTVQSQHTLEDIKRVSEVITKSEVLVRVNPIHDKTEEYISSEEEIQQAIENGADIVMLPFFKTVDEVKRFLSAVNKKSKVMLLIETPEAVENIDEILSLGGIDFVHIGLNDLSLGYGMTFMFELLSNGMVEALCEKIKNKNIPYGFGGIASLGKGLVPAEMIIKEHYRLDSSCAILSRSFCDVDKISDLDIIESTFRKGISEIRQLEAECESHKKYFLNNKQKLNDAINRIINLG